RAAATFPSRPSADFPVSIRFPPVGSKNNFCGLLVDCVPGEIADDRQLVPLAAVSLDAADDPEDDEDKEQKESEAKDQNPPQQFHVNHVENQRQDHSQNSDNDPDCNLQSCQNNDCTAWNLTNLFSFSVNKNTIASTRPRQQRKFAI